MTPNAYARLDDATVRELASQHHTPLYVFREAAIRARCAELVAAIPYARKRVRYACKALTIGPILRIIREGGLWIDAASANEVHRCLRAGFTPQEILYTGEGSTPEVYAELVRLGASINCTSMDQVRLLAEVGGRSCWIRVNPGEGHGETTKTNTGGPMSKHGIYFDELAEVRAFCRARDISIVGLHSHIGSGTDLGHWLRIKDKTLAFARDFPDLRFVDLGGGLPAVYDPETDPPMPLEEWGALLSAGMDAFSASMGKEIELHVEPGRYVVADSGSLIAEIRSIKRTPAHTFLIVNTGFNHNVRPAMYGAYHPIRFVSGDGRTLTGARPAVVAGYLCESGDVFTVNAEGELRPRTFPEVRVGDLMVMEMVGAYSHSMKSEYNSMNLPPSVLLDPRGRARLIERRGTLLDLMRREIEVYEEGRPGEGVAARGTARP